MNRVPYSWVLMLAAGCGSGAPPPAVLHETELDGRIVLDRAEPIDPGSVLFTLHADGRVTWKGKVQTPEDMVARASGTPGGVNRTPILLEVDPKAGFRVVRDALAILTGKPGCVNYSFLVATPLGPGVVVLPMLSDRGMGYRVNEGGSGERVVGGDGRERFLELIISSGAGGALEVKEVNFTIPNTVPALYFPPAGEKPEPLPKPPDFSWGGDHPPCGRWTPERLRDFLSRADVAALSPYVLFKISTREPASDVLGCLSALRSLEGIAIIPEIPSQD